MTKNEHQTGAELQAAIRGLNRTLIDLNDARFITFHPNEKPTASDLRLKIEDYAVLKNGIGALVTLVQGKIDTKQAAFDAL